MILRPLAALLVLATAGPAAADAHKLLVMQSEGRADTATRAKIDAAISGAQIMAIDWQAVLQVAQENAEAAGVADRYRTISGSAFEVDWGSGYDLVGHLQ